MTTLNRFCRPLFVVLLVPLFTFAQGPGRGQRLHEPISTLDLTDEQRDEIRPLRFNLEKKLISLDEKVALARLELRQLLHTNTLDQSAIEQKVEEISRLRLQKRTLRLDNWFEIRKHLTPDQQEKWQQALRMKMAGRVGRPGEIRHERMERRGKKMRERRHWDHLD